LIVARHLTLYNLKGCMKAKNSLGEHLEIRRVVFTLLIVFGLLFNGNLAFSQIDSNTKKIVRISSLRKLGSVLKRIEKKHEGKAHFVTMKLQIYLEDVYITQGSTVILDIKELSKAIDRLIDDGLSRDEIGRLILQRYQDGEFHV
jgi:hypothetical protein